MDGLIKATNSVAICTKLIITNKSVEVQRENTFTLFFRMINSSFMTEQKIMVWFSHDFINQRKPPFECLNDE